MNFSTEQENFWASNFGDEYSIRNSDNKHVVANIALFSKILSKTRNIESVIELGANIGLNLRALSMLFPKIHQTGVEINKSACEMLKSINGVTVHNRSILDLDDMTEQFDFVLTKTVLIHINPDNLQQVYSLMHKLSKKYICIIEYYNPTPTEVMYRGCSKRLFKRDFAGEFLDKFKNTTLIDYGFVYHRDNFTQDDVCWFLIKKNKDE